MAEFGFSNELSVCPMPRRCSNAASSIDQQLKAFWPAESNNKLGSGRFDASRGFSAGPFFAELPLCLAGWLAGFTV